MPVSIDGDDRIFIDGNEGMARPQEFDHHNVLYRAMQLFWKRGYEATSMADLVSATGLSRSSIYGSFGGKHELFLAAFDWYRDERKRQMELILGAGSARAAIETFYRAIIEDGRAAEFSNGCMSTNQAVELAPHDPAVRDRVQADFTLIEAGIEQAIRRGISEGSIVARSDPMTLARLFVAAFPGFQVMTRVGGQDERLTDALTMLLGLLDLP